MKKFLCAALALCLVFALAACGGTDDVQTSPDDTGVHANHDGVTPTDLETTAPTPTPVPESISSLNVNGVDLIKNGQITGVGYQGFEYADGKLTIKDLQFESPYNDTVISFGGGDLEIVVEGDCSITTQSGVSAIVCSDDSALTFSGSGSLTISCPDAAAIDMSGSVTAGCALNVSGSDACTGTVTAASGFAVTDSGASMTVAAA